MKPNKICPSCNGIMKYIEPTIDDNGVEFDYYECQECMWDENIKTEVIDMADRDGTGPRDRSPKPKGKKNGFGNGNC